MQNSTNRLENRTVRATSLNEIDACAFDITYQLQAQAHALVAIEFDSLLEDDLINSQITCVSGRLDPESQIRLFSSQLIELAGVMRSPHKSLSPLVWSKERSVWLSIAESAGSKLTDSTDNNELVTLGLFVPSGNNRVMGFALKDVPWNVPIGGLATFHSLGQMLIARLIEVQPAAKSSVLSKSERLCLVWCASGKTSNEIATILSLSEHTVNHYFSIITSKLGASSRAHSIAKAIKMGLISYDEIV